MYNDKLSAFDNLILKRYHIYNGLFLNLSYTDEENVGHLLPLLKRYSSEGLSKGDDPESIIDGFFNDQFDNPSAKDKLDFMFKMIQFIERQVVLYDSIEDSAFKSMSSLSERLSLSEFMKVARREENEKAMIDTINDFGVRITFTAHPTQFYPRAILNIIADLRKMIDADEIQKIDRKLHQLGLTSMLNSDKPTPLDEAKNIIHYMRTVYYDAIGVLYSELKREVGKEIFDNNNVVQLGFWPGGDRDGNPFVTYEITRQVADELRMTLMKCYYHDVKALARTLSFKSVDVILSKLQDQLYEAMFDSKVLIAHDDIMSQLELARKELTENYHSMFIEDLEMVIDKVRIFGTHFACMDIRQNHDVHERAVTEILSHNGLINNDLSELSEAELDTILSEKEIDLSGFKSNDSLVDDTLKNMAQIKTIQEVNGQRGCERYIISNSEDKYAVLFVFALLRWAGTWNEQMQVDVIPLFETMEGMKNSEEIMRQLFANKTYLEHVQKRKAVQTMMLGFSDGTKDGGYLQANWSIFKTKEKLSQVCDEYNIRSVFFDGRGGPPARGGGKTHRFYAAQSDRISNNEIQLTIQGQTITSTYGTQDQFNYNCQQMLAAGLHNAIYGNESAIGEKHRALIEELAKISFDKYSSLKQHPSFIPYLEDKSTLKYYAKANIGSRPAKRGGNKKLSLEDLRAISFVGSWSQLKQNVPGYFGIGTAINELKKQDRLEEVKDLFDNVPIFRALILNSMMSLAKTNFNLTRYMSKDEQFGAFWQLLHDECELTKSAVLEIANYEQLMEEEQFSRVSIQAREAIVLPLLVIQQYGLIKIQKGADFKEAYEKLVTRSLYGNINASRNSA